MIRCKSDIQKTVIHNFRSYDLIIEARDNYEDFYSSLFTLVVDIRNLDDNVPDFSEVMYTAQVTQGSPEDTFVKTVFAEDIDEPERISYGIRDTSVFKIDSAGVIRTARSIDPQDDTDFTFTVTASNQGKVAQALVNVHVIAIPRSRPRFTKKSYSVFVPENEEPGRSLFCMIAISSSEEAVKYLIITGSLGKIGINQVSGKKRSCNFNKY